MLNDRDEKYEGTEESEYHFSDDDVSYEIEPETAKPAAAPTGTKESIVNRLANSKRLIISAVVFLVLVFIVYRMVAPTTTPPTDIAAVPQQQVTRTVTTQTEQSPAVAPQMAAPMAATPPPMQQPQVTLPQPMAQTPLTPVQGSTVAATIPQVAAQPQPAMAPTAVPPSAVVQPRPATPIPLPGQPIPTTTTTVTTVTPAPPVAAPPQQVAPTQTSPAAPYTQTLTVQAPEGVSPAANLDAESAKLITQLQSEYITRVNEFVSQNKNLQDQVQALTARITTLESELNQLLQALTRRSTAAPPAVKTTTEVRQVVVEQATPAKVAYTVQAIIPGRAWLRADSGETVTVTDGDMIKGLGRVTKIDPYDGVVEVNTGSKVISLSYGNGA